MAGTHTDSSSHGTSNSASVNPPEKLHYYCDADSALSVLSELSLPLLGSDSFNGLTEINANTPLQFDKDQLTRSTVRIACSMIFAPDEPKGDSPLVNAIRRWRDSDRFANPDEAKGVLKELSGKLVDHRHSEIEKSLAAWKNACATLKLAKLFEKPDQFALWDKYGDQYKGVVFALNTDESSLETTPQPVSYSQTIPEITTLKEQVGALVYGLSAKPENHIHSKFLVRPAAYKAEKEWRMLVNSESPMLKLNNSAIKAVYFGPGIDPEIKTHMLSAIDKLDSKPTCYRSLFTKGQFDLHHEVMETEHEPA